MHEASTVFVPRDINILPKMLACIEGDAIDMNELGLMVTGHLDRISDLSGGTFTTGHLVGTQDIFISTNSEREITSLGLSLTEDDYDSSI